LHRFALICQKIKTPRDLDHAHVGTICHHKTNTVTLLGPTRAQDLTILFSAIPEKFKGV